ncbi:division plane positioning ATPase MipZ [Salinisphaera sp. SPP-AMP-43]|uniref:division plane positioning ATPase MipZ n=1 Tax=Salinisphaera sp. SPP-AMP-43 TaxID=3121288 RepID=UPI003C6E2600
MSDSHQIVDRAVHVAWQPRAPAAEAVRVILARLSVSPAHERTRCMAIAGCQPSEGRSTFVANLAMAALQAGETVAIVDAARTGARQRALFGWDDNTTSAPAGTAVELSALHIVTHDREGRSLADTVTDAPAYLGTALAELRARHDRVLIDISADAHDLDALNAARQAGAAVVLFKRDTTRLARANRLLERLSETDAAVLGSVLAPR